VRDKEFIQDFGGEASWETVTLTPKKEMGNGEWGKFKTDYW
jgi:hypothetical protein